MRLKQYKDYNHQEKLKNDIHFTIDHNGNWYFHGSSNPGPMKREALVKLFADKALKCREGKHYLETPFESYAVDVEDVPFIVSEFSEEGQDIVLTTNIGDRIELGQSKKTFLKRASFADLELPYIEVQNGLIARLSQGVREAFIEKALSQKDGFDGDVLYLDIGGVRHPVAKWEE